MSPPTGALPRPMGSAGKGNGGNGRKGAGPWLAMVMLLLLVAAGVGVYWVYFRGEAVATVVVERGTVVRAFYATGTVRPDFEFVMKAKAAGTVVEMPVREGSHVKTGQLLARVDDRQLKFEVERTAAELKDAEAQAGDEAPQRKELLAKLSEARQQFAISDDELKRLQSLFVKGTGSVQDVDVARRVHVQWAMATAGLESQLGSWQIESTKRVEVAKANLAKAKANLADTEVHSPVDGVVLERYIEAEQVVGINEKLFLVAREDDKLMKAAVDEEDVAHTQVGQLVWMQLYAFSDSDRDLNAPKQQFRGHVVEILPTANPVNKTFEVKVKFDSPPAGLRVGMTAELNFIVEDRSQGVEGSRGRDEALVVPSTAVLQGKVYRVTGPRDYEAVPVTVGVRSLEKWEIVGGGLKEGDRIVADAKQVVKIKTPKGQGPSVPERSGDRK